MHNLDTLNNKKITSIEQLYGKIVLVRIDVNITLGHNNTVDPAEDWRIIQSLQTIFFLQNKGARIVLLAHMGGDSDATLLPVFEYMQQDIPDMVFLKSFTADMVNPTLDTLLPGQVLMMENLRQHTEELENNCAFLEPLINRADIYINDAFSASHRKHASLSKITEYLPSFFGLQCIDEIEHLSNFMNRRDGVKVLVLGGAKMGTKLPLLEKMLPQVDYVLMGGALANIFLQGRGFEIGKSWYDDVDISRIVDNQKIILPIDYIDQHGDVIDMNTIGVDDTILDIGPMTMDIFGPIIDYADSIMWNGPMGKYEEGYTEGSLQVAERISHAEAFSITGGGDTATLVREHNLENGFDFLSTGGGAMLDFLVHGTLPGIDAVLCAENKHE